MHVNVRVHACARPMTCVGCALRGVQHMACALLVRACAWLCIRVIAHAVRARARVCAHK